LVKALKRLQWMSQRPPHISLVGFTCRAPAASSQQPAASSQQIMQSNKVAEDVVVILQDAGCKAHELRELTFVATEFVDVIEAVDWQ
jgi:hypothetical protein